MMVGYQECGKSIMRSLIKYVVEGNCESKRFNAS